jgi:hypothetical protein
MRGLRFRGFGVFAEVLATACLLLVALGGIVWATVDNTRGATSTAAKKLRAALATTVPGAGGNER